MDKDHVFEYVVQQRGRMLSALSVVLTVVKWRRRRHLRSRRLPIKYGPLVRLDELYNGRDRNCIHQLRMRKDVFWNLPPICVILVY